MKKLLLVSVLFSLSACQNPNKDEPFHWNGQDNGQPANSWEGCRAQSNC